MDLPDFITGARSLDMPIPEDKLRTHAFRSEEGLCVFFVALQDLEIPPHSHLAQWGTVLEGALDLTMHGQTRTYRPGESYAIAAGVEHAAKAYAGTKVLDIFEEPDRYPLRD